MNASDAPVAPGTLAQPLNGALLYIGVLALLIAGLRPVILSGLATAFRKLTARQTGSGLRKQGFVACPTQGDFARC